MHSKSLWTITLISAVVFFNCLFNGYVGDDIYLIPKNSFYKSWGNFSRLFTGNYITDNNQLFLDTEEDLNSGSVAYRPVLSATYFLDFGIWGYNPFGYHFFNVALHIINALLVYYLIFLVLREPKTALLAALIFSIHPMKSEPVSSIGYRADVLSFFFIMISLIGYLQYRGKEFPWKTARLTMSWAAFFLALFTKESAIILPFTLAGYEKILGQKPWKKVCSENLLAFGGYFFIAIFYLYVYLVRFPGSTLNDMQFLGKGNVAVYIGLVVRIFLQYLSEFVFPFMVKILPPYYIPSISSILEPLAISAVLGILVLILLCKRYLFKDKNVIFFLYFFLLAYLPISNIVPLAHPTAYRYLYLPSLGLCAAAAIGIQKISEVQMPFQKHLDFSKILKLFIILMCLIFTIPLNSFWKDNYTMARAMVMDFPQEPVGYFHLGQEHFDKGEYKEAQEAATKSLELGMEHPLNYYVLGILSSQNPSLAVQYFTRAIQISPDYVLPYVGLARVWVFQGRYDLAQPLLQKSIELKPIYSAYAYLIQVHLLNSKPDQAQEVYHQAETVITDANQLGSLLKMVNIDDLGKFPVDIGI